MKYIISITPEIALDEIPIYAGGLGILEGDKCIEAGKLNINYIVLTLFYPNGYVYYNASNGKLEEQKINLNFLLNYLEKEPEFKINLFNREVQITPLIHRINTVKVVYFIVNDIQLKKAIEKLYIEETQDDYEEKYVILSKASLKYIQERIGFSNIIEIQAQESLAGLIFLLLKGVNVKKRLIIHTPGAWGHPYFSGNTLKREYGINAGDREMITRLLFPNVDIVTTVSDKHEKITKNTFPEIKDKLTHVTNGVSLDRWMDPEIKKLLSLKDFSPNDFIKAHNFIKFKLLTFIRTRKQIPINIDTQIVLWARRITRYKRPYFITRLIRELGNNLNVVFILAGKAHPKDIEGRQYMSEFLALERENSNIVYFLDYDISYARLLLAGSDLLLFTPFSGWEACGTSYMKAGVNGVPTLASRDGGAIEIIKDEFNGWLFGNNLYNLVDLYSEEARRIDEEDYRDFKNKFLKIVELYNKDREKYAQIMINTLNTFYKWADVKRVIKELIPSQYWSSS
ncbi:MAG: glycogen/starch/alpha-glucan phosphorylase [Saccharolobus sp.]